VIPIVLRALIAIMLQGIQVLYANVLGIRFFITRLV